LSIAFSDFTQFYPIFFFFKLHISWLELKETKKVFAHSDFKINMIALQGFERKAF